ncbi:MAG: molybdopterin-guanine dinucleotide biosynthesis protein MobB, partial [Gilliamella sp.]|nr:molybdopterin-guanine dinucleotide biosynthesis protein MobB [Gilliamella sp.]
TLINQFKDVEIILIEGFKSEKIPKIICHRKINKKALYIDEFTIAVVSDEPLDISLPVFDINKPIQIVEFIKSYLFNQ